MSEMVKTCFFATQVQVACRNFFLSLALRSFNHFSFLGAVPNK